MSGPPASITWGRDLSGTVLSISTGGETRREKCFYCSRRRTVRGTDQMSQRSSSENPHFRKPGQRLAGCRASNYFLGLVAKNPGKRAGAPTLPARCGAPAARLRRLHAQACRLAETKPRILAHPEVARAVE